MTGNGTHDRCRDRTDGRELLATSSRAAAERERGQTTQDFAVGIGIFLLAIAFVFLFLPSVVTPFDSSVGGAETAQADRIADRIVNDTATGTGNEINFEDSDYDDTENLTEQVGLRASSDEDLVYDRVNVTIERLNGSSDIDTGLTAGDDYTGQPAASSARIVTLANHPDECRPACRLVVRVW
ncbi:hypothetical protein ACERIM_01250 [Natrinema sp. H-ect1]|uniref:DUF7287 family protein n=1 Tax=Natrinema sp. H-ect1 TaxID=3242700 RepID=UPI00359EF60C